MLPRIAYLIDENAGWSDAPSWRFYPEDDPSFYRCWLQEGDKKNYKRIVYWEIEDET